VPAPKGLPMHPAMLQNLHQFLAENPSNSKLKTLPCGSKLKTIAVAQPIYPPMFTRLWRGGLVRHSFGGFYPILYIHTTFFLISVFRV